MALPTQLLVDAFVRGAQGQVCRCRGSFFQEQVNDVAARLARLAQKGRMLEGAAKCVGSAFVEADRLIFPCLPFRARTSDETSVGFGSFAVTMKLGREIRFGVGNE